MRRLLVAALCFSLLLPAVVLGQAVTLKRTPKVGEVLKYRLTFVFTVYGNDVFYTSVSTDKVTSVDKDGTYTVESEQQEIKASNGNDLPIEKNPQKSITVYTMRGMVVDLRGEQASESWRDANLSSFILPEKPVSKGDSWTVTIPAKADRQTPEASIAYTCDGPQADKLDGFNVVRIDEVYAENSPSTPAKATGTIWVNPSDGTVVKMEANWRSAPILGLSTIVNGHVSYERVP